MARKTSRNVYTLAAYTEVCRSYHAIDDFRAKLLAALPIVSGAGGFLLLANAKNNPAIAPYVGYIGVFGALVTFGLACYEWRGLKNCERLINTGRELERKLRLIGQFEGGLEKKVWGLIDATTASFIVYTVTLSGWICVAIVGFVLNCSSDIHFP